MANKEAQRLKRERIIEENGIIFLDNVSKSYSTGSPALNGVTLSIGRGEFVFIVGDRDVYKRQIPGNQVLLHESGSWRTIRW